MSIEELIKNLDPVSIIEFKNYIIENLSDLCSTKNSNSKVISKFKKEELFFGECGCNYTKMGRQKTVFKNMYVVNVR